MPLTSLYLISLDRSTTVSTFIPVLVASLPPTVRPLLVARPLRWIINPWFTSPSPAAAAAVGTLTTTSWDLLVLFPSIVPLADQVLTHIRQLYALRVGISSKIVAGFDAANARLLHPTPGSLPSLTGSLTDAKLASTTKDLELSSDILQWFRSPAAPKTAPSMLNLIAFNEGKHDSYKAYGQAFASSIGSRRGGVAKIVGSVPRERGDEAEHVWDEIAVAHYPTVWHFADMVGGKDYQEVNKRHRVGALRGTAILCCDELDEEIVKSLQSVMAKI